MTLDATGEASLTLDTLAMGSHTVSAAFTSDSPADFSPSMVSSSLTVEAATEPNIESVVNDAPSSSGGAVTLQTTSDSAVRAAIQAINSTSPSGPVTVTLDLGGGTYTTDTQVNAPSDVTVVIQDGTLVGGSPALVVDSGSVILDGVTATNATEAPTIVVNGGSLIVRDSTIEESTGYAEAAILINGGTVDLGTATNPGGNTLNVNGSGEFLEDPSSSPVTDTGNTLEVNGAALLTTDLSLTALSSSAVSTTYGQSVTLTATVAAADPADGCATGSVEFVDATTGVDLGTVPLTDGVAQLTTSALTAGTHAITAEYLGDSSFAFSVDTWTQTVAPAALDGHRQRGRQGLRAVQPDVLRQRHRFCPGAEPDRSERYAGAQHDRHGGQPGAGRRLRDHSERLDLEQLRDHFR